MPRAFWLPYRMQDGSKPEHRQSDRSGNEGLRRQNTNSSSQKKPKTVASDDVSRRLAKIYQVIADDCEFNSEVSHTIPEHILWMAVIERAINDYVHKPSDLTVKYSKNLDHWFFNDIAEPCNLVYICTHFLNFEDAVPKIRKRLLEMEPIPEGAPRPRRKYMP